MKPTEGRHKLELTTPTDFEIVMTRTFEVPRALLFDAFTKPELIARWLLGPDGWSMPVCDVDLRAGGAYRYVWRNDTDGREFGVYGVYREIVRPERIVHTEQFDQPWYPSESLITTSFAEEDGRSTVTMTQRFDSREVRDAALESGMEHGVAASYDRLAVILEQSSV
jgi:uncharacterized protein YndB with AHSA1/START domain